MIYAETFLKINDNSGGLSAKCIHNFNSKKKGSKIMDKTIVTLKKVKIKKKIKRKNIFLSLIVRTKINLIRNSGRFIKFFENSVILVNDSLTPIANRIIGPMILEFRNKKFSKIVSISSFLV